MKKREQLEEIYKWDLTPIYLSIEEFKKEYKEVSTKVDTFKEKNKNKDLTSENIYEILGEYHSIIRNITKLYVYANLNYDSDTTNNRSISLRGKVINLDDKFNEESSFLIPNIIKIDYNKILTMYDEFPRLKEYQVTLKNIFRYKEHTLKEEEENILSSISSLLGKNEDIYEILKESDISFNEITIHNGDKVKLNDTNYKIYIESQERSDRKTAFKELYKTYKQFSNTYATTLYNNIKENITLSKIRKYKDSLTAALYSEELTPDIYNNLIEVVNSKLNTIYKYYDLRKKVLNIEELHLYDIYTPLISKYEKTFSYKEGFKIVKEALKPLGEEYQKVLDLAYNQRWIDVYPNIGKVTGGYSGGCYDTYPYILLNYQDKYNDMSTLAHELGHSVHSYYSRTCNSYQNSGYTIFVAEVASTVNELLLAKYLLKNSNSKEEKLYILNNLIELFRATIYRQTMFAEFEKEIYQKATDGEVLTSDNLSETYYNLNKKYFGNNVIVDEEIKYEWARIPHFYYNFYVYKYATGLSAACYIVENIIEKGEYEEYLKFLKCGITKSPIESLQLTKVDLRKKEVVTKALDYFENLIKTFEDLY